MRASSAGAVGLGEERVPCSGPRRRAVALGGGAWRGGPGADGDADFAAGQRVFHEKFGYGRIVAVDGNKLEIAFDKAGTKKVIDSFVEPA